MHFFQRLLICVLSLLLACQPLNAEQISLDQHALHYAQWGMPASEQKKPVVLLLSGPIDTWHSDSAWWFSLAPSLADKWHVIALDRAGQVFGNADAPLGYRHFAHDLHLFIRKLGLQDVSIISFASANISVMLYLQKHADIHQVLMIDPDVLSPYSINRYKQDAQPFIENAKAYAEYIAAGKYTARVEQKNAGELAHIRTLIEKDVDIGYLQKRQANRLDINNQLNLFKEIAAYPADLDAAANLTFPANIRLTVIDTQFEQGYINDSEDEAVKQELRQWMQDAKAYYQGLAKQSKQGHRPSSKLISSGSLSSLCW